MPNVKLKQNATEKPARIKTPAGALDSKKTKAELIDELLRLRNKAARLDKQLAARMQAEEALKQREQKLLSFMDSATDAFHMLDADLNIVEINRPAIETLIFAGLGTDKKEDVLGKNYFDVYPFLRGKGLRDKYTRVLETGETFSHEDTIAHPKLGGMYINIKVFRVGGGIGTIASDITDIKVTEGELREREEMFRLIFEKSPVGLGIINSDGFLVDCNDKLQEIIGAPLEKLVGINMRTDLKDKRQVAAVEQAFSGQIGYFEGDYVSQISGKETAISTLYGPIFSNDGSLRGVVFITEDISARKKAEAQLREFSSTREMLLREVNHRVKNNFTAILSLIRIEASRLEAKEGKGPYYFSMRELQGRISALLKTHNLLSAGGWMPLELETLSREIISGCIKSSASAGAFTLEINHTPAMVSHTQAHHLTLVLNELATNSLKYAYKENSPGSISLDIKTTGQGLLLRYADNGPGYPQGIIEEDFSQCGIGFQLIRGIVMESLRGQVNFKNEQGAVAVISLPAETADKAPQGQSND